MPARGEVRWLQQLVGGGERAVHARQSAAGMTLCGRTFSASTRTWQDASKNVTCRYVGTLWGCAPGREAERPVDEPGTRRKSTPVDRRPRFSAIPGCQSVPAPTTDEQVRAAEFLHPIRAVLEEDAIVPGTAHAVVSVAPGTRGRLLCPHEGGPSGARGEGRHLRPYVDVVSPATRVDHVWAGRPVQAVVAVRPCDRARGSTGAPPRWTPSRRQRSAPRRARARSSR